MDNGNGTAPNDPDDPMEEEFYSSWALLILTSLLIATLFTSYFLQRHSIRAVHESVVAITAGMLVGLAIKLSPGTIIQRMVQFNQSYFFNLLLPPIILNSGYELKRRHFFYNFGTILTFALVGTFIAALVTGGLVFLYAFFHPEGINISFIDSMIFGSILSATDPVTVLAIFSQLHVDPQLFSIISGESLLNDAVAIVLSETLHKFRGQELHVVNIFKGIGVFMGVFTASTLIGVLFGIIVALMLKHSELYRYPSIETCVIALMAYSSYLFSNGAQMSGIVTLLFSGITLKHYAYDNMSLRTKRATKYVFQVLSQLSENFIFIYLGVNLFTQTGLDYKPVFILVTTVIICIARYVAVAPLSMLINAVCRALSKSEQILPRSHQLMLFWAGLRGAVAFALASGLVGDSAPAMRTTILAVVVLTVLLFGGTTSRMLQLLEIQTGVMEADDSGSDEEDDQDLDPMGYRKLRPTQATAHTSNALFADISDDEDDENGVAPNGHGRGGGGGGGNDNNSRRRRLARSNSNNNMDVSIGGLLSGPLGDPIPEPPQPHWFMSFDEKWLKPLFTKRHIQARNQTLADYWREKRRKMDRANRNMLAGIRSMSFGQSSHDDYYFDDDDDDNADALTLGSVHNQSFGLNGSTSGNGNSGGGPSSSSQRLVIGAGRVFGRSPVSSPPDG